jgi:hypothetical protein
MHSERCTNYWEGPQFREYFVKLPREFGHSFSRAQLFQISKLKNREFLKCPIGYSLGVVMLENHILWISLKSVGNLCGYLTMLFVSLFIHNSKRASLDFDPYRPNPALVRKPSTSRLADVQHWALCTRHLQSSFIITQLVCMASNWLLTGNQIPGFNVWERLLTSDNLMTRYSRNWGSSQ